MVYNVKTEDKVIGTFSSLEGARFSAKISRKVYRMPVIIVEFDPENNASIGVK